MLNEILKNSGRFIILVLIQALIVSHFGLGRFINPFIYVLFILMLPFEIPGLLLLVLGFLLGIVMDLFSDTMGMHTAASVFMAFCRPAILKLFSPREGYSFGVQPTVQYLGIPWFLSYAGLLIFLHHLILFYTEVFRFSEFFSTLLRVILSSAASLMLVLLTQFLFYKGKK